jgi:hypothetical protein
VKALGVRAHRGVRRTDFGARLTWPAPRLPHVTSWRPVWSTLMAGRPGHNVAMVGLS